MNVPFRNWFRRPPNSTEGVVRSAASPEWGATTAVLVIGLVASLGLMGLLRASVTEEARVSLVGQGELLRGSVERYVQLVIEQARGFRGLFEASDDVTAEEFDVYSRIVGSTPSSAWVFATHDAGGDGSQSWHVQQIVVDGPIGIDVGDDLYRDPVLAQAIDQAVVGREASVSGFIEVQRDTEAGDVAVFVPVTRDGGVVGVVGAVVQLDELLDDVAEDALIPGQSWAFEESNGESGDITTSNRWSGAIQIGLRGFRLSVETEAALASGSPWPTAALFVGIMMTALAARLVHDLERRRRTDRELEWLRRSSVDKDRFLAGVGHELRTPLTAVVGILELAIDPARALSAGERVELLATARHSANDIARIVDDFVAAGRMSADALTVRKEPTDLDAILAKLMASANFDARLQVKTATDLGLCLGDGLRIAQILLNLLHNASRNARRSVEIAGLSEDRFVTVEVRNDGPAVATQLSHSLFEPFVARTEGQPQPIGLGLSVSRALARRMGGDLAYQWRDGLVVFALKLPALPIAVPALTSSSA